MNRNRNFYSEITAKKHVMVILFIITMVGLNSCCAFKKGSWDPLPSCKNVEKNKNEKNKKKEEN